VKGKVEIDRAIGIFLSRKIHLVELVDHEKFDIGEVVAAEDAFLRQNIDRDPVGLRLLAGMRDDGAAVPEPSQQTTAGFVDKCERRHDNDNLAEFFGGDDLVDDEAFAGAGQGTDHDIGATHQLVVDARLEAMKDDPAIGVIWPVQLEGELIGYIGRSDGLAEIGKQADVPYQRHQDRALGYLEMVEDGQGADDKIAAFVMGRLPNIFPKDRRRQQSP
jgi:hypothetical protein